MVSFSFSFHLRCCLPLLFLFSCSSFQKNPFIEQEKKQVDEIRDEIREEIKADKKAGKDTRAKKEILNKLDNYSVNLDQDQKNERAFQKKEEELKKESKLADYYRAYRSEFLWIVGIVSALGIGLLAYKFSDVLIPIAKKLLRIP